MLTKDQITDSLNEIPVPGVIRGLASMNLIKNVDITDKKLEIELATAALSPEAQGWLKAQIELKLKQNGDFNEIDIKFTDALPKDLNRIKTVIAVMSGKGGVGKSLVTSLAAVSLRRQGYEVGILDADITGPSIPRMFGIKDRPSGAETGILPVTSKSGIEIMSINLLLPNEDDAVIWRGPLIGKAITQFWEEVLWGNLDFMMVDLPPGTADAPLSVMQSLPVNGVIVVFTPQELTAMIVKKAVKMAQQMQKPVFGIVENMSYLYLPELDKKIEIFGKSHAEDMERASAAPLLAQLPLDPELAKLCDDGKIERYSSPQVEELGKNLLAAIPLIEKK
jgi:ATP-binding protein involved in chromosome partitioning